MRTDRGACTRGPRRCYDPPPRACGVAAMAGGGAMVRAMAKQDAPRPPGGKG
ncbi:MAG: hypothetical protein IT557_01110 [Alphaproteobacteria bacterium]|nr:hypothetical protein [Alphaproteobacteria bacterium]